LADVTCICGYDRLLASLPCQQPWQRPDTALRWHLYVIRLPQGTPPEQHRQVFDTLRAQGVGVILHYIPIYLQPYNQARYGQRHPAKAERYYRQAISLPLHAELTDAERDRMAAVLNECLTQALCHA
jgi:dTDP-4-amino-4,6-dideoxygalactose transaminase